MPACGRKQAGCFPIAFCDLRFCFRLVNARQRKYNQPLKNAECPRGAHAQGRKAVPGRLPRRRAEARRALQQPQPHAVASAPRIPRPALLRSHALRRISRTLRSYASTLRTTTSPMRRPPPETCRLLSKHTRKPADLSAKYWPEIVVFPVQMALDTLCYLADTRFIIRTPRTHTFCNGISYTFNQSNARVHPLPSFELLSP